MQTYGKFSGDGAEFTITNPATPRAFDNFLWNDAVFSNVEQTGVGYCDYQVGENEAVQLLTGNGRVCDFDIFGRESLMSRLIYVRDNDTGEFWNVNWEPVRREYEKYACTHGMGYTSIASKTEGIASDFMIFIPKGSDPVELWSLKTVNESDRVRNLSVFVYNQFQFRFKWGFDSYGDMLFRTCVWNRESNAVIASKHPHVKPHDYLTGFMTASEPIRAFDGTRDAFMGHYGTLGAPDAVVRGQCTNTPGSSDATIGVMQFDFSLASGELKEIEMLLGATDSNADVRSFQKKYFGQFDKYFAELKADKAKMTSCNIVKTPDEHFDKMFNYWMKEQSSFGADWCRWGWNGYRDIVQHGYGVVSYRPERTREIICEALRYQYKNGLALRGWNPIDTKPYSDCALWLVFTFVAYIQETDDTAFLDEVVPFYDEGEATVMGHIRAALDFLEEHKGSHDLCLIKFGDWNDSLTAVGKNGKGESVWLTQAYAEALRRMSRLSLHLGDTAKSKEYDERYARVKEAINKTAWDGDWYVRCFSDNGDRIGSHENEEGQMFIESQAWALIAGIADEARAESLINSCDKMLLTNQGYKLLAPTFTRVDERIGRISCMEPGICENGTIYSHVNIWMILGLLSLGRADKAYEAFKRITPGYYMDENDLKHKCPPYVYANCYYGPDHANNAFQMEFTWITGSIAWYNMVMAGRFLGVEADYDGLRIQPCVPSSWKEYSYTRKYRNSTYEIAFKNPKGLQLGNVSITIDGKAIEGNLLPIYNDGGVHKVVVEIG